MAQNSVGTLFVDLKARTAQLEVDMGKVKGILKGAGFSGLGDDADKAGQKVASSMQRGMVGAMLFRAAIREVVKEIGYVIQNVEKIPGVSPQTIASVQDMRAALAEAKDAVDNLIASVLAFMAQWGKMIGTTAADIVNGVTGGPAGDMDIVGGDADQRARLLDKGYDAKVDANHKKLIAAKIELRDMDIDMAQRIKDLREENEREAKFQENTDMRALDRQESELRVLRNKIVIKRDLQTLERNLAVARDRDDEASAKQGERAKPIFSQLKDARNKESNLRQQLLETPEYIEKSRDDGTVFMEQSPEQLERLTRLTKEHTRAQLELNEAIKRYGDLLSEMGSAMSKDLVEGILHGEKMHDIFRKLITDVVELIVKQEVEKPLAAMFTSGLGMIGGLIMGHASGGPYSAGEPFIAGENGPELINPGGTAGSVVDAASTARASNGRGGSLNIIQNQNFGGGVTQAQLMSMVPMIVQQSKAAVLDAVRRGGAYRQTFLQGN